jgi:wyosine [tRNA(Phe)-imidazoG37] synthetase (radical SAM superfamily)
MKIVYGPIASWRLGRSLGVDLICQDGKVCSFDCIYCQLKKTEGITRQKRDFVTIDQVKEELTSALKKTTPNVITFSGMGEPTLAKNMNKAIQLIRELTDIPIAILTNSSMFFDKEVQKNLKQLDIIVAKLDAPNTELFKKISRPAEGITFEQTLSGIKSLRKEFNGKFALQMMFMRENKDYAHDLAELAREINPDQVQINTPLRYSNVKPLSQNEIEKIKKEFTGVNIIDVYSQIRPKTKPLDITELYKRSRMEP